MIQRISVLALAAVAAGVGLAPVPQAGAATGARVTLKDISFRPGTVTIRRGQSVRWTWRDGSTIHNVTFNGFRSTTKSRGTYTRRFTRRGTFRYRCTIHPGMSGKVIVR